MRIASVCTDYPGPGRPHHGLFVQRRLKALAQLEDLRVIHPQPWFPVLRPRPSGTQPGQNDEQPPALRPNMFYLPGMLKALDGYWVKRAILPALRSLEAEGQLDLIDAHFGYPEGVGCALAARSLGRPVFITMRGLERQILGSRLRRSQMLWALQKCTGIICVSESLKELAVANGIPIEKIRVIPNAVDRETYRPDNQVKARGILNLEPSGKLVVSVGMLVRRKGQHILVRALARLHERNPGLRLALIGGATHEPRYPEGIRKLVEDLGLAEVVYLPGPQSPERVALWLRAADLFVLPTYDEGCCNAILEALACGLPVVTTPVGDNALQVDPPRRGLLVPVDDVGALAEGIEAALKMSWDRTEIARYGADYTWDEVARQTAGFFRERLAAHKG